MARAGLGISQTQLASRTAVSFGTIRRMEQDDGPVGGRVVTVEKLRSYLTAEGIEFVSDGVVFRQDRKTRRRAWSA